MGFLVGTKVNTRCGKPIIGDGIYFTNDRSATVTVPDSNIELAVNSINRKFTLDKSINLSNMATTKNNSFMAIDPENYLIVCYDYDNNVEGADWMVDCWILLADVNSQGKLVLNGFLVKAYLRECAYSAK